MFTTILDIQLNSQTQFHNSISPSNYNTIIPTKILTATTTSKEILILANNIAWKTNSQNLVAVLISGVAILVAVIIVIAILIFKEIRKSLEYISRGLYWTWNTEWQVKIPSLEIKIIFLFI